MSNCTQQAAGCQKERPIKAGRLYYMKLLLITQSQKQKTNRQKDRETDRHTNIIRRRPERRQTETATNQNGDMASQNGDTAV